MLEDLETGEVVEFDTSGARGRDFARRARRRRDVRDAALRRLNVDVVEVQTERAVRRCADRVLPGAREEDGARMKRVRC